MTRTMTITMTKAKTMTMKKQDLSETQGFVPCEKFDPSYEETGPVQQKDKDNDIHRDKII